MTHFVSESLRSTGPTSGDGMTCGLFHRAGRGNRLGSLLVGFHARELAKRITEPRAFRMSAADSGLNSEESLAFFDQSTQSWRTSQLLLFGGLEEYSATFTRSGLMRNGKLYLRPLLARPMKEKEFSLWPTAQASDAKRMKFSKEAHLKQQARNRRLGFGAGPASANLVLHCQIEFDGCPTANFVEWLMGCPMNWTAIEHLATA